MDLVEHIFIGLPFFRSVWFSAFMCCVWHEFFFHLLISKKICDEAVAYEVELLYLPDGVKVGDTVSIVDDDDNTYLTARLLKLEASESNDTKEAELGDYVRQESGIDEKVIELAERFEKIAKNRNFYT